MKNVIIKEHVNRIAEALSKGDNLSEDIGMKYGKLGVILFFFVYNRMFPNSAYRKYPFLLLENVVSQVNNGYSGRRINEQYADFGWFLEFSIKNEFLDIHIDEINAALTPVDEIQIRHLELSRERGDYDIITGMLSSGYYFLSRIKSRPSLINKIKEIVDELYNTSYFNPRKENRFWKSKLFDDKIYLGISHGVASIILFLIRCYEAGIEKSACATMIKQGISFILSTEESISRKNDALFPVYLGSEKNHNPLEWCYGDLSVAYGLHRSSKVLDAVNRRTVQRKVIDIVKYYTLFRKSDIIVEDAGLVNGVAGIGLLFNKFYGITGAASFYKSYIYWINEIFKFSKPTNALAGFSTARTLDDFKGTNSGLFSGVSGIGLFLMEYLDPMETSYHEFFYLS